MRRMIIGLVVVAALDLYGPGRCGGRRRASRRAGRGPKRDGEVPRLPCGHGRRLWRVLRLHRRDRPGRDGPALRQRRTRRGRDPGSNGAGSDHVRAPARRRPAPRRRRVGRVQVGLGRSGSHGGAVALRRSRSSSCPIRTVTASRPSTSSTPGSGSRTPPGPTRTGTRESPAAATATDRPASPTRQLRRHS